MDFGPPDPRTRKVRPQRRRDRHQEQLRAAFDPLNVKPDWEEYHRRFCSFHGGNEVEIRGKLVLPDGWSISSTSYKGPEWPPPDDKHELAMLLTEYWTERRGIVRQELRMLQVQRDEMVRAYGHRSIPVPRKVASRDEAGAVKVGHEDIGLSAVDARMAWLGGDVKHCEAMIEEYSDEQTGILRGVAGVGGGQS